MTRLREDWRAGGEFSRLSEGRTFWRREGAADGMPLVLIHGATVPSWEFDLLVPPLLRAGFQTLRFDLYAHGASDHLSGEYRFERFARQVAEIMDVTQFPRPSILLGHSFGAALASAVAVARPDLVSRLVLVAPMLEFSSTTTWAKLFRIRGIGELAMQLFGTPALVRRRRRRYAAIGLRRVSAPETRNRRRAGQVPRVPACVRRDMNSDPSPLRGARRAAEE